MQTAVSLVISATLLASAALAGPVVAPDGLSPATSQSTEPAPAGTAAVSGKTVDGLIVTGSVSPRIACRSRDAVCINLVVAELKRLYPKPLKQFCAQRQWRDIRRGLPVFGVEHQGGPALKIACAADNKQRANEDSR